MAEQSRGHQPHPSTPPLSVWATGQHDIPTQLRDAGCVPGTDADAHHIPPAIAAHAIATYTHPGDLVLDPDCGTGTVLVAALRADRHALGLTSRAQWWTTARANITTAKRDGATRDGSVLHAGPQLLTDTRAAGLIGHVELILTALRAPVTPSKTAVDFDRLADIAHRSEPLLRTTGRLVVIARPRRHPDGSLVDTTTGIIHANAPAGLVLVERCIALTARLRDGRVMPRASLAELRAAKARTAGAPVALIAHHEVLVFQRARELELAAVSVAPDLDDLGHRDRRAA